MSSRRDRFSKKSSTRRRACATGKVRYRSLTEAKRAARRISVVSTRERIPTRAYECPMCRGAHLTAKPA